MSETFDFLKTHTNYSVTRIGTLYKDFKQDKELNPEGYEANLISWYNIFKTLLVHDFFHQSKLTIPHTNPDLSTMLLLPVIGKPLSLDLVINELVNKKYLIPVSTFIDYEADFHTYISPQTSILSYLSPFHWANEASKKGKELLRLYHFSSERYIVWASLCEFGKALMSQLNHHMDDGIYSSKVFDEPLLLQFIHEHMTPNFSMLDLQILIKYLSRDTRECSSSINAEGVTIVKFIRGSEVTSQDMDIAHVRTNIDEISKRIGAIESKIASLNKRIAQYPMDLIKKDETIKATVMHIISQKRHQVKTLHHTASIHTQLTEILTKIDSATSNVKIFNVLKQSAQTLNTLNAQVDIYEVEQVNDDIKDQIDQTDEISEALGGNADQDVEDEFNELLKEHEQEQEQEQKKQKQQQEKDKNSTDDLLDKLNQLSVDDKVKLDQPGKKEEVHTKEKALA